MLQNLPVVFAYYIKVLNLSAFNRIAQERAIRDSLILLFAKPYIHLRILNCIPRWSVAIE